MSKKPNHFLGFDLNSNADGVVLLAAVFVGFLLIWGAAHTAIVLTS